MRLIATVFLIATASTATAQTCGHLPPTYSLWSSPASWGGGAPPVAGSVVVGSGQVLVLDPQNLGLPTNPSGQYELTLDHLTIDGELYFDCTDLHLTCERIDVGSNGALQIGTATNPVANRITISLGGQPNGSPTEARTFAVAGGGRVSMHGTPRTVRSVLTSTVSSGTAFKVEGTVDWVAGEEIAIASTGFDFNEAERHTITSVSAHPSGSKVTVSQPLANSHFGQTITAANGLVIDCRGEVVLLDRNLVIESSDATSLDQSLNAAGLGAHFQAAGAMTTNPPTIELDSVEFRNMGEVGTLGKYPIHFHHAGDVSSSYVRGCVVDVGFHRGLTIHNSSNLTVSDNVLYECQGHALYLEDGSETGNVIRDNVVMTTRRIPPGVTPQNPSDNKPAAFYISHLDNTIEDNVAAGSEGYGFYYAIGESAAPAPMPTFSRNRAHSVRRHGFYLDNRPLFLFANFDDFTAYKCSGNGVYFRSYGATLWNRPRLADNASGFYPASTAFPMVDGLSTCVIDGGAFIGESSNNGDEPWMLGTASNHFDERLGLESYDGDVILLNCSFEGYFDALAQSGFLWRGGGIGSVQSEASWQISPRNYVENCTFAGDSIWFRALSPIANSANNTVWFDVDGSITGSASSYVVVDNPFLIPPSVGNPAVDPTFRADWNAWIVPAAGLNYAYAALLFVDGAIGNPAQTSPIVPTVEFKRGFSTSGLPVRPSYISARPLASPGASPELHKTYPTNILLDGEYEVIFPSPTPFDEFTLSLRAGPDNREVLLEVPYVDPTPSTPPTVDLWSVLHVFVPGSGTSPAPGAQATSLAHLRTDPNMDYFFDPGHPAGSRIFIRLRMRVTPGLPPSLPATSVGQMVHCHVQPD